LLAEHCRDGIPRVSTKGYTAEVDGLVASIPLLFRDNAFSDTRLLAGHGLAVEQLRRFVAGTGVFSRQSHGTTIVGQYSREGMTLRLANMDRVNGRAEVLQRLGDPEGKMRQMRANPLARTSVLSQVAFGRSHGLNSSSALRFATPVS
jgi:hypothetical protein